MNAENILDENEIETLYQNLLNKINFPTDKIITINSGDANYLSELMDDLPHNAYINKGATGCGGTTLAITNNENYVIAVHSKNVVINKSKQHKNLCPIYSETTPDDINDYLNNPCIAVKKFIVTYDSVPRLLKFIDASDFRLLVDEVQVLIRYLGHFKTSVCHALLKNSYKFKSVSYLTATPTERCYLPEPLKKLDYVEIKWKNLIKPEIKHMYCGKQLQTKVVSFILDKLDNTDDEIYIFYNSKTGVTSVINKLLATKQDLNINDIKIVFANNNDNIKFFRRQLKFKDVNLSHEIEVDENGVPIAGHNKRINFISSFGFEGVDFYSFGKNVITLVVADSFSKSMRYDISIDLPQIIGRFRRDKNTGLFPKNDIFFIWKSMHNEIRYNSEEEIIRSITRFMILAENNLKMSNQLFNNTNDKEYNNKLYLSRHEPYLIVENIFDKPENHNYIVNEYAMEGIMSVYSTNNIDYHMLANNQENSIIENSLKNISSKLDTFSIPQLKSEYSLLLSRNVSFAKIAKEYYDLYMLSKNIENKNNMSFYEEEMQSLLEMSDLLRECLEYNSVEYLNTYKFSKKYFENYINNKNFIKNLKSNLSKYGIIENALIPLDSVIPLIEKIYSENGITAKVKKTSINELCYNKQKMVDGIKYLLIESIKS